MAGNATKCTEQRIDAITESLAAGAYREPAALAAGISESTFYRWMEKGEADHEHDAESPQRELWERVKKAEAEAQVKAITVVRNAALGAPAEYDENGKLLRAEVKAQWTAAMTYLERKYPTQWGRRLHVRDDTPRFPAPLRSQSVAEYEAAFREAFGDQVDIDVANLMPSPAAESEPSSNGAGP